MKDVFSFTRDDWFQIGKIISNEFNLAEKSFSYDRYSGYNFLDTNQCDEAPLIRVYNDFYKIYKIQVCGHYTDGWQDIQPKTMDNIIKYLTNEKTQPFPFKTSGNWIAWVCSMVEL